MLSARSQESARGHLHGAVALRVQDVRPAHVRALRDREVADLLPVEARGWREPASVQPRFAHPLLYHSTY